MKMHVMSHVKVRSLTTYHILMAEFGELPIEFHALKLSSYKLSTIARPCIALLVSQIE
jgi:hypothetical protein